MSTNTNNASKKLNMDPRSLTFVEQDPVVASSNAAQMIDNDQLKKEVDERNEFNRIAKLKTTAVHLYMPDDPAYKQVSDDLLAVNELSKNLDASTRVMINVALGDYGVFRRKTDDEDKPEQEKLLFRRVYFEDFDKYQDTQDDLNDINRRITLLETSGGGGTEAGLDRLKEYKKQAKAAIAKKIDTGLEVFFKKSEGIRGNTKKYDYNDMLFNVEIGVFRYTRAPFLRQISSTNTS